MIQNTPYFFFLQKNDLTDTMELKCSMYVSMKGKQSLGTGKKKRKSFTVKIQMPFIAVNRVERVQLRLNPAVGSHIDGGGLSVAAVKLSQ